MKKIVKRCNICGKEFIPKTVTSVNCSRKCSDVAYKNKKAILKKEANNKAVIEKIPEARLYISVPEAVALFGLSKTTIYRLIKQKRIKAVNLGTRKRCFQLLKLIL